MNIFKTLSSYIWGEGKKDLVQASGTLYEFGSQQWRCRFNTSTAIITSGESGKILVIRRDYEEGEQREDDPTIADVLQFPVAETMKVVEDRGLRDLPSFNFSDSIGKRFQFEFDNDDQMTKLFLVTLAQCLYEATYNRPASEASEQELQELLKSSYQPTKTPVKVSAPSTPMKSPSTSQGASTPLSSQKTASTTQTPKGKQPVDTSIAASEYKIENLPSFKDAPVTGKPVFSTKAHLYALDIQQNTFIPQFMADVSINFNGDGKSTFTYSLVIYNNGQTYLVQNINNEMFARFDGQNHSIVWSYLFASNFWTWSLVFSGDNEREFKSWFARALYEHNSGQSYAIKDEDQSWLLGGLQEDVQMEEDDGYKEVDMVDLVDAEEEKALDKDEEEESEEEEKEEEPEDDDSDGEFEGEKGAKNSLLSVGYKTDRSFVVRGSKVGVFKNTPHKVKYQTQLQRIKDKEGKVFSPKRIMLHKEDQNLLMLHPDKNNVVYKMDLNRDDVVEEWKVDEHQPVLELFPQSKTAPLTSEEIVGGLNSLGFMALDPRLPKTKMISGKFYKPTTKPQLSCAVTTASGHLAVGSKTGDVRLYSEKTLLESKEPGAAPRAKTALPGFGDPIIGIDTTEDGLWILATCRTYLLVIPTETSKGRTGFEVGMGKEKPAPRRLQLRREDIAKMQGKINFTPARFNMGEDQERSIVTSTGPYVITWNFRKVKQGKLDDYQIKQYEDTVVADQFRFGDDKSIVVTLPDDVKLAKRSVVKTFTPPRGTPQRYN